MTESLQLDVNIERVVGGVNHLATISECPDPPPAVTRIAFTQRDLAARQYLATR